MKPTRKSVGPAATGGVTIHNRLPPKHPRRLAFEGAIRSALTGLTGDWVVVVDLPGELSLDIAVVAPDGSAWSMSCCNPERRDPEAIAETVRAACNRRRWLEPAKEANAHYEARVDRPGSSGEANKEASTIPPHGPDSGGHRT